MNSHVSIHGSAAQSQAGFVFGTTSRTIFNLPVWMAIERGFFRDQGLDLEVAVANSLDHELQMLRSGEVHVGLSAPDALMAESGGGGSTAIVAGNADRLPHFIIVNPRIKSLAGLKGATIGVAGAYDGTTSLMGELAKAGGFALSDLNLKVVGGAPARVALLREGKIDAGMQPFPQSYISEAEGFNNLGALLDIVPYYAFAALVVDRQWAKTNRTKLVSFLRALAKGNEAMFADADAAATVAAREMGTTIELARRAVDDALRLQILSRDLSVSRVSLGRVFQTLREKGRVAKDAKFEWTKYVDESYLADSR